MSVATDPTTDPATVAGIFNDENTARQAMQALRQAGFDDREVGLVAPGPGAPSEARKDLQDAAADGATAGAVAGGGLGVAAGVATALIPGVGPVILGGLLTAALVGGAAGAAAGVFAGPFIGLGMADADARRHAEHIERGRAVVLVRAPARRKEAVDILLRHGAYDETMNSTP